MKSSENNQLLARLLLMPLTDVEFNSRDFLCEFVRAYDQVVDGTRFYKELTHSEAKDSLKAAKRALLNHIGTDSRWSHLDDIQMRLDLFYPGYKLVKYYDRNFNELGKFYVQHILDIARTFITFRDGVVSARSWAADSLAESDDCLLNGYNALKKIELWNNISRTIPMDIVIAATYVNFGVNSVELLIDVPNLVSLADVPLSRILKRGVAETHIHMNVGFSYSFLWKSCVGLFKSGKKSSKLWFCTFFRIFSAIYIEEYYSGEHSSFQSYLLDERNNFSKEIRFDFFNKYINGEELELSPNTATSSFKIALCEEYGNISWNSGDILFDTIYHRYSENGTSSEIIWYFKMLNFLQKNYDAELCREFLMYIRLKNNYFKDIVQKNEIGGLDFFQNIYHNASHSVYSMIPDSKQAKHDAYYSIFEEQCRTGNLEILELKITPPTISSSKTGISDVEEMKRRSLKQIIDIVQVYREYIINTKNRSKNVNMLRFPKLGIVYHFIKQNDFDNFSGYRCILSGNADEFDCMDYGTMRTLNLRFCEALRILIQEHPLLSKYIVGIDAASLENSAEPWVFAPVFRSFRPDNYILPVSSETRERISNIGFTYHVGEDFRHIASGLRHIDEVISHFNYCSGDRLGHAIALGVDIDKLVEQNRVVVLPIMEYMENLLWIWSKSVDSATLKVQQNLEYTIMATAQKIYHNIDGINVYTLWQTYNEKFNIMDRGKIKQMISENSCRLNPNTNNRHHPWSVDELLCSHFCPCYFEQYSKPIFVRINDEEISLYKALQNYLRSRVEEMGIYVETNPSSNTAIGDIEGIYSHPILNLNHRGLGLDKNVDSCVMTTINSDDPLVFSTCVDNEIAYIYYSLLNAGCKREQVLDWIDKIRRHGLESSFVKYCGTYDDMVKDFNEILNYTIK